MKSLSEGSRETLAPNIRAERRIDNRVMEPFPVQVQASDQSGEQFSVNTVVDNISRSGVYLRLPRRMAEGSRLHLIVTMSLSLTDRQIGPNVEISGSVLRVDSMLSGASGVAVKITSYRFL